LKIILYFVAILGLLAGLASVLSGTTVIHQILTAVYFESSQSLWALPGSWPRFGIR
jgi:hypothetical protein